MTWPAVIAAVAAAIGRGDAGAQLVDGLRRAAAGEPAAVDGGDDFLADLDRALRRDHSRWTPGLLAQAGAVLQTLPQLLGRIRRGTPERPVDAARLRYDLDVLVERAAVVDESTRQGGPCPRCGSRRVDVRSTTVNGPREVERLCLRCGLHQTGADTSG